MILTYVLSTIALGGRIVWANRRAAYYSLIFIGMFGLTYWLMGLEKHFDVPAYIEGKHRNSLFNSMYTSVLAQSNAMPDTTPKTTVARTLFMIQVSFGWMWFLLFNNAFAP